MIFSILINPWLTKSIWRTYGTLGHEAGLLVERSAMRVILTRCISASLIIVLGLIFVNILMVYRSGTGGENSRSLLYIIIHNIYIINLFLSIGCDEETMKQAYQEISSLEKEVDELQVALRQAKTIIDEARQKLDDNKQHYPQKEDMIDIPTIFMITPTYLRWTQKADLTRLCQTLMHVKNLHWIVVEDADKKTMLVKNFLQKCPVVSTHLNIRTSTTLRLKEEEPKWRKSRGVEQRNLGLRWLRESNYKPNNSTDVVYFGDDDNTYGLDIFEEVIYMCTRLFQSCLRHDDILQMRYTKLMSVWPVGICGGLRWEGPVCRNGQVTSWHTAWAPERPFPIDFAGKISDFIVSSLSSFSAFSLSMFLIIKHKNVNIDPYSKIGRLESDFLSQLVDRKSVEAKADNCKKVGHSK